MADEMDFLELVIASERVAAWIDVMHLGTDKVRCRKALMELAEATDSSAPYAEEARQAGAPNVLSPLLKMFLDDDEALSAISRTISACAGVLAATAKEREFCVEGHAIRIHEGLLGDGVGTRVWAVATTLCRELAAYPDIVAGKEVLEIGSGCGLTGIFAAKLGAQRVTLTDFLPKVVDNLLECMHANGSLPAGPSGEDFDPEDEADGAFEADNMRVRMLDWAEGTSYADASTARDSYLGEQAVQEDDLLEMPPELPAEERFPVIIGTDVIYEPLHAELVANVVARRLQPGGVCLLCCGVRIQSVFDQFFRDVAAKGLRLWKEAVTPQPRHGEVMGREAEYEGGFLLMFLDWQSAPGAWHRSDAFA
eukprot:jgi/Tetstr1/436620/TSEL_025416.t1